MSLRRPPLTYANVVATLALVMACTGGGVAVAAGLQKNSVGSPQIRNGQVKAADLAKNSVRASTIRDGSVRGAAVRDGSLTGADVADDSLTGDQVDESSLDTAILAASEAVVGNRDFTGGLDQAALLEFEAPTDGWVMITAQASMNARSEDSFVHVRLRQNGAVIAETDWDAGDVDGLFDQHQTFSALVPVATATHEFELVLEESDALVAGSHYDAQLLLTFSPRGSLG